MPASTNGHPPLKQANKIAMAANSDQLRIFDLTSFDCELLYGHTDIVLACDVSPDGLWLASVSKDQTIRLWDISDENNMQCRGWIWPCRSGWRHYFRQTPINV